MADTFEIIAQVELASDASSIEFTDIPGTYTDLYVAASLRCTGSVNNRDVLITFNGSSANYVYVHGTGLGNNTNTSASAVGAAGVLGVTTGANAAADTFGNGSIYIKDYADATKHTSCFPMMASEGNASDYSLRLTAATWEDTAAVTSLKLAPSPAEDFAAGSSAYLYGILKA